MKNLTVSILSILLFTLSLVSAQQDPILPGQLDAVRMLAVKQGFTIETLDEYLYQQWGSPLSDLTKADGAKLIRLFQSEDAPTPADIIRKVPAPPAVTAQAPRPKPKRRPAAKTIREPILAEILEVGMNKRFHLVDGSIYKGEIVNIVDGVCHIETIDGLLKIPSKDILEERAEVTKKDDSRYIGPVLSETTEEMVLRSKYGDVVISKRDVNEMNRYHGGERVPWEEEKKTFFRGEVVLTDIFMDPTAFPLEAHTFYVSGLSLGYGFTERFMVRTRFGSDLAGDLNMQPHLRFYHRQTGSKQMAAAVGAQVFNHHPMSSIVAKYSRYIEDTIDTSTTKGKTLDNMSGVSVDSVLNTDRSFYWEFYVVLSSRHALETRRGEVGWHVGFRTNSMLMNRPELKSGYIWQDAAKIPYRIWAGFEYDLTKNLKFAGLMWVDNGHRFRTFSQSWNDYFGSPLFVLDAKGGTYRDVDFDFGFLYAVSETFRVGIHFQEPFLVFYWEFFEL